MEAERKAARDDLAALRIDRDAAARRRPPRGRRVLGWAAAALALLAALGVGLRLVLGGTPAVRVAYAERSAPGAAPAAQVLTGSGYVVTGERYIALGVRVPSRIEEYLVEEGQRVEAGQALVRLDARSYEAALREARASLLRARADVELQRKELARARELVARDVASQADLDVRVNALRVAEAEVARLEAEIARREVDLEDTVVRAPTAGVILEKFKEVGEIAVPGGFEGSGELIRMANLEDLRAEVDVNEADLARVAMGQPAEVTPDAYPDRTYAARVVKLYPQINRQKGTLKVEVKIAEPDEWLRPDMSVRIAFLAEPEPAAAAGESGEGGVVLAPRAAVRGGEAEPFAWVVTEGRLRRQPLAVAGPSGSDRVVVAEGLAGGEALVVGEAEGLREGQAVEVVAD
jgi:RND family efflux transporter MFP subunit